jgi:hypothetical protein
MELNTLAFGDRGLRLPILRPDYFRNVGFCVHLSKSLREAHLPRQSGAERKKPIDGDKPIVARTKLGMGTPPRELPEERLEPHDSIGAAPTGLILRLMDAFPGVRCASPGLFSVRPYGTKESRPIERVARLSHPGTSCHVTGKCANPRRFMLHPSPGAAVSIPGNVDVGLKRF